MNVREWVKASEASDRAKRFMDMRLKGDTLQEIGTKEGGLSRERVRQILEPLTKNKPELDEDKFEALYWFQKYSFLNYDYMKGMFDLPEETYNYYDIFYRRNKKNTKASLLKDKRLTEDLRTKFRTLSQPLQYFREEHWHDYALETFKWAFDTNPHGRLTVIDVVKNKKGKSVFKCKCECGNIVEVTTNNIKRTKSCGCLMRELPKWVAGTRNKKCKNLDTGEVFNTVDDAADKYGISRETIYAVCNGRVATAKGFRWAYLTDTAPNAVRCVETGEIYSSISKAQKACGFKNVHAVLNGTAITAGGYHWEFVDPTKNGKIRR